MMAESLGMCNEMGDKRGIMFCLIGLAGSAGVRGDHRRAAWLSAAAEALISSLNILLELEVRPVHEQGIATARQALGEQAFQEAWNYGQSLPLEQVVAEALETSSNH